MQHFKQKCLYLGVIVSTSLMLTACSSSENSESNFFGLSTTTQSDNVSIDSVSTSSSYMDTAFEEIFPNYVDSSNTEFYWRIIPKESMFLADTFAKEKGMQVYLDLLQSDNQYKQYFAINKLVQYYNDESDRAVALEAVSPFMDSDNSYIADASKFAVSILSNTFDNPNIYSFYDGSYLFTLFNNYSDYGSYNEVWMIKNGKMELYQTFDDLCMYVSAIVVSPDKEKVAISLVSNKSTFLQVNNEKEQMGSPEIITSSKNMMAKEKNYKLYVHSNFENYSEINTLKWIDNDTIQFNASYMYNYEDDDTTAEAVVIYNVETKEINFVL